MKYAIRGLAAFIVAMGLACPMMNRGQTALPAVDLTPAPTPRGAVCRCNRETGVCHRTAFAVKLSCPQYAESLLRVCPVGEYMPECYIIVFACWSADSCAQQKDVSE